MIKNFSSPDSLLVSKIREGFFRFKDDFGSITVDEVTYSLNEIHLKSPSEHAILSQNLPAEL